MVNRETPYGAETPMVPLEDPTLGQDPIQSPRRPHMGQRPQHQLADAMLG